jgi:hypothetical protein
MSFDSTVELHLSGLTGTASHPDVQKFGCYYLQNVPASKPFGQAWSEVPEAITLYALAPITGNFKASSFCRNPDKFAPRAKPIRITRVRISAVLLYFNYIRVEFHIMQLERETDRARPFSSVVKNECIYICTPHTLSQRLICPTTKGHG